MSDQVTAPNLPGYAYVRKLGGGGFADVHEYRQQELNRTVAVKVLRAKATTEAVRAQFRAEAMRMAALSEHDNIVTVHDAAVAADGRPYLVMAYCPNDLAKRYRAEVMSPAEVIGIGIQLAAAVETAHRMDILHRDIKPANVLITAKGRPALTDFGISASATATATDTDGVGMSIPWSPPEMLADTPTGDARADVYSLAATLYTLLARRSPFEMPGWSNAELDVVHRIERTPLPPIGRVDLPSGLERTLTRAMDKSPDRRFPTALAFARALQDLQTQLGMAVTPVDISAEDPVAARAELAGSGPDDGRTRIRALLTIDAQGSAGSSTGDHTLLRGTPSLPDATSLRVPVGPQEYLRADYLRRPQPPADTQVRAVDPGAPPDPPAPRRARTPLVVAAAVVLVLAGGIAFVLLSRGTAPSAAPSSSSSTTSGPGSAGLGFAAPPAAPTGVTGRKINGGIEFTWTDPQPQSGNTFRWQRTDVSPLGAWQATTTPRAFVPSAARACISVDIVRSDSAVSNPSLATCFPVS